MARPKPQGDLELVPVLIRFSRRDLARLDEMRGTTTRADWIRAAARFFTDR